MSDLVVNPEDRFSHKEAHNNGTSSCLSVTGLAACNIDEVFLFSINVAKYVMVFSLSILNP